MPYHQVLAEIQQWPRIERLRLLETLVHDLAREEEALGFYGGAEYPIWSPTEAHEAASQLKAFLENEKEGNA